MEVADIRRFLRTISALSVWVPLFLFGQSPMRTVGQHHPHAYYWIPLNARKVQQQLNLTNLQMRKVFEIDKHYRDEERILNTDLDTLRTPDELDKMERSAERGKEEMRGILDPDRYAAWLCTYYPSPADRTHQRFPTGR